QHPSLRRARAPEAALTRRRPEPPWRRSRTCVTVPSCVRRIASAGRSTRSQEGGGVSRDIVVTPLNATLAARVEGVDLRKAVPDDTAQQIRDALWQHQVLVFPDPDATVGLEEQIRLAELFGEPQETPVMALLGDGRQFTNLDPRLTHGKVAPRLLEENP